MSLRMFAINLGGSSGGSAPPGPGTALAGHAGTEPILSGASSVSVVFTTLGTTAYGVIPMVMNYTDASPIFLQVVAVTKAATGFTVNFNAPTDSANYVLEWVVVSNA